MHLVLLPGMDGTGNLFANFVQAMQGRGVSSLTVVSFPTDSSADYAELRDIARRQILVDGPIVLLGESFSGPIAIELANQMADRVLALILCVTFVKNPQPIFAGMGKLLPFLPLQYAPHTLRSLLMAGNFNDVALASAIHQVQPATLRARLAQVLKVDVSQQLTQLTIPILYLQAKHDKLVPASAAALICRLQRRCQLRAFDGPHMLLHSAADETAAAVCEFLDQLSPAK